MAPGQPGTYILSVESHVRVFNTPQKGDKSMNDGVDQWRVGESFEKFRRSRRKSAWHSLSQQSYENLKY